MKESHCSNSFSNEDANETGQDEGRSYGSFRPRIYSGRGKLLHEAIMLRRLRNFWRCWYFLAGFLLPAVLNMSLCLLTLCSVFQESMEWCINLNISASFPTGWRKEWRDGIVDKIEYRRLKEQDMSGHPGRCGDQLSLNSLKESLMLFD